MADYMDKIKELAYQAYEKSPVSSSVRQLKAWGTVIDPRTSEAQKRAAGDTIVEGVGGGLTGMIGNLQKGKAWNNQVVEGLRKMGATVEQTASPVKDPFYGSRSIISEITYPDGKKAFTERVLHPKNSEYYPGGAIKISKLDGPRTGTQDVLYPMETQASKDLGVNMEGTFVSPKTLQAFDSANPTATRTTPTSLQRRVEYPEQKPVAEVGQEYYDKLHADNPSLWTRYENYTKDEKKFGNWLRNLNASME